MLFTNVEDGFMHSCTSRYFAYSIAYVNTSTRKITINRSQCYDGISQLVGGRRYHFVLTGEMALVSNTLTRYGRHSYVINWPAAPGPNAFVDGVATGAYNESGSHGDWDNGALWDNITDNLLQVKLERPSAGCMAWNCVLGTITFENMPLSPNWSFGTTNSTGGATAWRNSASTGAYAYTAPYLGKAEQWYNGTRMPVRSLYENQVAARLAAASNPYRYQANPPTRISYLPIIRTPAQLYASSGSAWSYQLPVSNIVAATKTPNYTVTGLPVGVTVNATTGRITGTLPTVATATNYTLSVSARNIDGTATKAMTLTVRPTGAPKIPLTMAVEVDIDLTTPLPISGTTALPVPMVPASRLLAPMIVRKSYTSDINGTTYTTADVPVPVSGVLSLEGLTSPIIVTYNGSTTLPTLPGYYDIVATLDDPIYSASATGRLLITNATAVTVTLGNTTAPTAASPVTASSTQPTITPVITYDGSTTFPTATGHYTAEATVADPDYFGSRAALIDLPPQITQQPVSLTVNQGASATFSVAATGIASTYQWRKAGVAIPSATGTSYTITSAQGSDTGSYDVLVTDQTGVTTSATATLTVIVSPQITQQPASLSAAQNSSASFTVIASGGALSYQWRKATAPISGATGSSYTIAPVQAADAAAYDVVVTNPLGNVTSSAATLTVVQPPQIIQQPLPQIINQGTATTFTVSATGIGNTYQWRKAGAAIPAATETSYAIPSAQATDAASYDVVVTNIAGNVTSDAATLTVIVPPQITQHPLSQVVTLGASTTLTVGASGISATYQWRKDGVAIPGATGTSYTIASVQTADSGTYDVVVTNPAGSATSAAVPLTLLNPIGILKLNNTTALDLGGSWTGSAVPGIYDTASWNGTYTSGAVSIGTGLSVGRLQLISPTAAITLNTGTGPITLGGGGLDLSASTQNLTINAPVVLAASQPWTVAASRTLTVTGAVSDGGLGNGLTFAGAGTVILSNPPSYSGQTALSAGTLSYNGTGTLAPFSGPLNFSGGTLRANQATATLTLNSTNLPAASSNTLSTLTGTSGATVIVDASPTASLTFGSNVAGFNVVIKNGNVTYNAVSGSTDATNIRVDGGTFTIAPSAARYQIASSAQTFQVTGGLVDVTKVASFGFRVGGTGSSSQAGAQNVAANQSGGTVLTTTLNLGGTDTTAVKSPSYTLSGGTLTTTGSMSLGADTNGNGTTTFALSGTGKLRVPGTISGSQSGARQIFAMTGGTLVAATVTATNLRSADLAVNGTFTQSGGTLAPGDIGTAGKTAITGDYQLAAGGTLAIDLGGTTQATAYQTGQYDYLTVSGTTSLAGNLTVRLVNGFTPLNVTTFTVLTSNGALTGAFAKVVSGQRVGTLDGEGSFIVTVTGSSVTLSAYLPLSPATGLLAAAGTGQVVLSWAAPLGAPSGTTYTVWRSGMPGGPYASIAAGLVTTTFTDTGLAAGSTYYYQVTANQYGIETASTAEVSAMSAYTALQSWRLTKFGTAANTGTAADAYDYDGDGIANLLEYTLGTSPTQAASKSPPVAATSGNRLTLNFFRAVNNVTYIVEASSDLVTWSPLATNPGTIGQNVTVTDTVDLPTANPPRRFLRLRVVVP